MKRILLPAFIFISMTVYSQRVSDDLRPVRLGVKAGAPNAASLELEIVTPLMHNSTALFLNYSGVNFIVDQVNVNWNSFELGSNIYFGKNRRAHGLYGALAYQNIKTNLSIEDYEANDGSIYEGNARTTVSYNGLNVKLGAKLGRKFFFRTELGYSFGQIPKEIFVKGTFEGEPISETTSIEKEIEDLPFIFQNGLPIFNVGFGFSF